MARLSRSTVAGWLGDGRSSLAAALLVCGGSVVSAAAAAKRTLEATPPSPSTSIDLTPWCVQLPIGSPGHPTEICPPAILRFSHRYFAPQPDGSIKFDDPGVNCVRTAHSAHCRSELREVSVWQPTGTNTLIATLQVVDARSQPVIGQIHDAPAVSVRPLLELFYNRKGRGRLVAGVEQCLRGGCIVDTDLGPDPVGKFSYVISYSTISGAVQLSISIDSGAPKILRTPILGVGGYFKAGAYGQSPSGSAVIFYAITIIHKPKR